MERSLLIGIAIIIAIIAALYVFGAAFDSYPTGAELIEMLGTAIFGVMLIGIACFAYFDVEKERELKESLVNTFENSDKNALNTMIEIKDDFAGSKEIINLEDEDLTIGKFDKDYVLKLGNKKHLYITDDSLLECEEYKIYHKQNSSMIIFDEKPQKKK